MLPLQEEEEKSRRVERDIVRRKLRYSALFFFGTILAALGWFVEWKGLASVSRVLGRLTLLALVGHALQVLAAFGLLMTPDVVEETEPEDETEIDDGRSGNSLP